MGASEYTLDGAILDLRWRELLQDGCGAILAHTQGRDDDRYATIGRMLRGAPTAGGDLAALVWLLVALCARIARRDGVQPDDVAAGLRLLDPIETRSGRMQQSVIRATRVWLDEPNRGRILALENSGWKQARFEAVRLASTLLNDFDAVEEIRGLHGDIIPIHEPYSLTNIVRDLRRLLCRPRLGTQAAGPDAINARLLELEAEINAGATDEDVHFDVLHLALLRQDLDAVAASDPGVMGQLCKRIEADDDAFFGVRCELTVAAKLATAGYRYEFDAFGQPDFILLDDPGIGIECTSRHRRVGTGDLVRRIDHAIADKAAKAYASTSTGLVIEVTNLLAWSVDRDGAPIGGPDLQRPLEATVSEHGMGFVVLLAVVYDHSQRLVHSVILNRADHPMIEPRLKSVGDRLWPGRGSHPMRLSIPYAP